MLFNCQSILSQSISIVNSFFEKLDIICSFALFALTKIFSANIFYIKLLYRGDTMILRVPAYYNRFRCIADKCTDNCCIGWEIDIDAETAEYYASVGGAFGERLKDNISHENSFILRNERCPFLNGGNLCDIIINCGEEHLCQICRDHPRYFEWYGDIKEGGIGLSCEEGARLILTDDTHTVAESLTDEEEEPVDRDLFTFLTKARDEIFFLLDGEGTLKEKLCSVLLFADELQFYTDNRETGEEYIPSDGIKEADISDIISLYSDFEPIDSEWEKELSSLISGDGALSAPTAEEEKYMLNLCRYFIWRYFLKGVFDEEILSKVKLAVVSVLFIKCMTKGDYSLKGWIEKSKLYSKQMEYSDENRERFYDYTYEKDCLCVASLLGVIRKS